MFPELNSVYCKSQKVHKYTECTNTMFLKVVQHAITNAPEEVKAFPSPEVILQSCIS
jgi:hypothetical protein